MRKILVKRESISKTGLTEDKRVAPSSQTIFSSKHGHILKMQCKSIQLNSQQLPQIPVIKLHTYK